MKKKLTALALCVCMLASMSVTAYAADETSHQPNVNLTVEEKEVCTYTLDIPASVTLQADGSGSLQIFSESVTIPDTKQVVVRFDGTSTFTDSSNFYLYKDKGTDSEARIPVYLAFNKQYLLGGETLATFLNGSAGEEGGTVVFSVSPGYITNAEPGNYSGAVYFTIAVEDI